MAMELLRKGLVRDFRNTNPLRIPGAKRLHEAIALMTGSVTWNVTPRPL
jgi:hypothetical protein